MLKINFWEYVKHGGITSFCVANPLVITAVLKHYAQKKDEYVLFEATSNQVNHMGGYTGMCPSDYKKMVFKLADEVDFPKNKIVFGGDHLGPLPFRNLPENDAMIEAEKLVRSYVLAGFEKLHIDTSMVLGHEKHISNEVIAERGSRLIMVAEEAFEEYKKNNTEAIHPVYILGSEVPPAGGKSSNESHLKITSLQEVKDVLETYEVEFIRRHLSDIWKYVVAIVIQPGVEFGHTSVDHFVASALGYGAKECQALDICFEAHSTDYQSKNELSQLVANNFLILKVGPALTKSLTEALLKLDKLKCIIDGEESSDGVFSQVLKTKMLTNKKNWQNYYTSHDNVTLLYSLLDRSRYYLSDVEVSQAIQNLLNSFGPQISKSVPAGLLRYYFPEQFRRLAWEQASAVDLVNDYIACQIEDYDSACCMKGE